MTRLATCTVLVFVLSGIAQAMTEPCNCGENPSPTTGPIEPIADPDFLQTASVEPASLSIPSGLNPGDKYHVMFATSFQTNIDSSTIVPASFPFFGGLDAADWTVTYAAFLGGLLEDEWSGFDTVYQAVLSINGENARDRINVEGQIFNTNGDLIALDGTDLWDGSIQNPVGFDEMATAITGDTDVWTGSNYIGAWKVNESCGCWDIPSSFEGGRFGNATITDSQWASDGTQTCNLSARLYGISPALTVPGEPEPPGPSGPIVPEPSTFVLGGIALVGLIFIGWRRRKRN